MKAWSPQKISVLSLVLLITGAIDSVRNLPTTALFGSSLIFFFVFSAIIFLLPVSLVSAELASTWPEEEGGVYSWVKLAFGKSTAFFTIWLQWINTMVWYPTILSFIAATFAYLLDPALAQSKWYLVTVVLLVFWSLTLIGLSGLQTSARFASFCTIIGMVIPMILIISLAIIWMLQGKPLAIDLSLRSMLPDLKHNESWISLTAIMTSFLGIELAAVHVRNVENPLRNFPRAMLYSVILILTTMVLGSLAIACVLPAKEISLIGGVMQAFANFLAAYQLSAWMPVVVVLLLLGSLGNMVNWIISPAKGLLMASREGFLPQWLCHLNDQGIATRILLLQALLVTLLCSGFLLLPSINGIYWLFTDLSTELYIMMYMILFLAALRLKSKYAHLPRSFTVPGKRFGYYCACTLGLLGCGLTLVIGFFPPEGSMNIGSTQHFRLIFSLGIGLLLLPAVILWLVMPRLRRQRLTLADVYK